MQRFQEKQGDGRLMKKGAGQKNKGWKVTDKKPMMNGR